MRNAGFLFYCISKPGNAEKQIIFYIISIYGPSTFLKQGYRGTITIEVFLIAPGVNT